MAERLAVTTIGSGVANMVVGMVVPRDGSKVVGWLGVSCNVDWWAE